MSQPQHTYSLRKEIGFGVEIALSIMGEPHEIQIEDQSGAYTLAVRTTTDPLASIRALSQWISFSVTPGVLTPVPAGVRKIAVEIVSINSDAPKATVFHMPGFFRGTESARYYGVDQLDSPGSVAPPIPFFPNQADLEHHYDYTDINVLWQDTLLSVPITANGQSILGVTDKGAGGVDLNKGLTPRIFDDVTFPFSVAGGTTGVNSGFVAGTFPPPQTFFVVYQVNVDSLGDLISLEGTSGFKISTKGDIAFNSWYNSLQLTSGAPDEHDKWLAAVVMHRANSTQSLWHSQDSVVRTGTVAAITLQQAGDIDVCAFNTNNTNPNRGPVAEAGAWNVDDVGVPTLVDDFKTYTSNEYGVVWA